MAASRKDFHLFGLGNALLDIQVAVDEDLLRQLQVPKGTMALVDHEEQRDLIAQLQQQIVQRSSGGSAANTIITFARLGGRAAYGTILGNDELADFIAQEFAALDIALFAPRHSELPTGSCLVLITPDAERTMKTALAANLHFSPEHVVEEALQRSEWLYVEGYKFSEQLGAEAIDRAIFYAQRHETEVAVTVSDVFIIEHFRQEIEQSLKAARIVFCNEQEAMALTEQGTPEQAFRMLSRRVDRVIMTRGAEGSWIWWEGREYRIPAYPANPVDTTGAGDTYAAAFLFAMVQGKSPEVAGHFASLAGARVVSQFGARLSSEHIQELKQLFPVMEKTLQYGETHKRQVQPVQPPEDGAK